LRAPTEPRPPRHTSSKKISLKIQEDESVPEMFHRLQDIVNEVKALGEEVKDSQFSMKFLRSLPKRFDTLITMLVKTTLGESTPQQVFQEVMINDAYRENDETRMS